MCCIVLARGKQCRCFLLLHNELNDVAGIQRKKEKKYDNVDDRLFFVPDSKAANLRATRNYNIELSGSEKRKPLKALRNRFKLSRICIRSHSNPFKLYYTLYRPLHTAQHS